MKTYQGFPGHVVAGRLSWSGQFVSLARSHLVRSFVRPRTIRGERASERARERESEHVCV